jgi:hypothetical protein
MPGFTAAERYMIGSDLHMDGILKRRTPHKQKADTRAKPHVAEALPQHTFCCDPFYCAAGHGLDIIKSHTRSSSAAGRPCTAPVYDENEIHCQYADDEEIS